MKKRNGFYQESDINRAAKIFGLSHLGVKQLLDSKQQPVSSKATPEPKAGPKQVPKPSKMPETTNEFDLALIAYFKSISQNRLDFYHSDERPYLNDLEEFRNFFELHVGTEDEL